MAIVVSDTSPIRALNHLGILSVLEKLYGLVYIPDAVALELRRPGRLFPSFEPARYPLFQITSPQDAARVRQLQGLKLDPGEAAAIVLALEKNADRILIDERMGRQAAQSLGLPVIGVLGVLLAAKQHSHIVAIAPLMDRLQRELEFHLAPPLIAHVLKLAGE